MLDFEMYQRLIQVSAFTESEQRKTSRKVFRRFRLFFF